MSILHKEGTPTLSYTLIAGAMLGFLTHTFAPVLFYPIMALVLVFFAFFLNFFRNPKRHTVINPKHIVAPADGKVVVIEETVESEYFKDKRLQVSIFMSPMNVHVNRNPVSGITRLMKYHPGKYLVAWHPKSSTENERTTMVIEMQNGTQLLMRQIAGALARRIVWYPKDGDKLTQGEDMGFIKFGSRVDLFLPIGTKLNVQLDQMVRGGETVVAEWE